MGFFRATIYAIIFGVYAYTLFYDIKRLPRIGAEWWVYKLVMLSSLNLVLQAVYSTICFICALLDWRIERKEKIMSKPHKPVPPTYWRSKSPWHQVCDFMYFTSAFPVGIATCLLFWGLYYANPEMVMPAWIAKLIPPWYNQVTHTAPIGFLLIDTLLTCHHAPSKATGSVMILALFTFYTSLILSIRYFHGYWLYPVFDRLPRVLLVIRTIELNLTNSILKIEQNLMFIHSNGSFIDVSKSNLGLLIFRPTWKLEYQFALFAIGGILFWFLYLLADGMNTMLWGTASHVKAPGLKTN